MRLETLFTDDCRAKVTATWGVDQCPIQAYRTQDSGLKGASDAMPHRLLKQAILDRLEEIQTLSKALICDSHGVLAYIDCPCTPNAPAPGHQPAPGAPTQHRPGNPQPHELHDPHPRPRRTSQRSPGKYHLNQVICLTCYPQTRQSDM